MSRNGAHSAIGAELREGGRFHADHVAALPHVCLRKVIVGRQRRDPTGCGSAPCVGALPIATWRCTKLSLAVGKRSFELRFSGPVFETVTRGGLDFAATMPALAPGRIDPNELHGKKHRKRSRSRANGGGGMSGSRGTAPGPHDPIVLEFSGSASDHHPLPQDQPKIHRPVVARTV